MAEANSFVSLVFPWRIIALILLFQSFCSILVLHGSEPLKAGGVSFFSLCYMLCILMVTGQTEIATIATLFGGMVSLMVPAMASTNFRFPGSDAFLNIYISGQLLMVVYFMQRET